MVNKNYQKNNVLKRDPEINKQDVWTLFQRKGQKGEEGKRPRTFESDKKDWLENTWTVLDRSYLPDTPSKMQDIRRKISVSLPVFRDSVQVPAEGAPAAPAARRRSIYLQYNPLAPAEPPIEEE